MRSWLFASTFELDVYQKDVVSDKNIQFVRLIMVKVDNGLSGLLIKAGERPGKYLMLLAN